MSGVKPAYCPPPKLLTIKRRKKNGLRVASLFSGAGGSTTGYVMAGCSVVYANEFISAARETYLSNHKKSYVDKRDIREVCGKDILDAAGTIDILDGSPPCSGFSLAGAGDRNWNKVKKYSDTAQRTDDLFFEYVRILKVLQPKAFIAENVAGLVSGRRRGYFKRILAALSFVGYDVEAKVLDAAWLGVPQARKRVIFVGIRKDLGLSPIFPRPDKFYYTLRDACPWIDSRGQPEVEPATDMSPYAIGKEWRKLFIGQQSRKYVQLYRSHPDLPVNTITATGGKPGRASIAHPFECRKFSIKELKRLCGFPDDYILTGNYRQQYERLGRSVPPVMMERIVTPIAGCIT